MLVSTVVQDAARFGLNGFIPSNWQRFPVAATLNEGWKRFIENRENYEDWRLDARNTLFQ